MVCWHCPGHSLGTVKAAAARRRCLPITTAGEQTAVAPGPAGPAPTSGPPPRAVFLTFFVSFIFNDVATATTVTRRGKIVSPLCSKQQVSTTPGKDKPLSSPCPFPAHRLLKGLKIINRQQEGDKGASGGEYAPPWRSSAWRCAARTYRKRVTGALLGPLHERNRLRYSEPRCTVQGN